MSELYCEDAVSNGLWLSPGEGSGVFRESIPQMAFRKARICSLLAVNSLTQNLSLISICISHRLHKTITGFPCGSAGKDAACNAGDLGLIPGLGRSPGEGKGYPFQYSGLENSMGCIDYGVSKSQTRLRDFYSLAYSLNHSSRLLLLSSLS